MRLFIATFIVGVAIFANSYAEGRDQDRGRHGEQRGQDQYSQVRQTNPTVVRERQRPIVQQVQEFRQSVSPQRTEIRRTEVSRVHQHREPATRQFQRSVQPTIIQSSQQESRNFSRVDRERHRQDRGHGWRHNQRNNTNNYYYGGSSGTYTVYPYFGYPYLSTPYTGLSSGAYPNRYFICYTIDQADEDSVHVSCPYGTGWYSTSPRYDTYQYRSAYRPEYVCPQYGADQFIEFRSSSEANNWWNQNCDEWIDNPDSDY